MTLGSPTFFLLPGQNLLPDSPIEKNQLLVDGKGGPNLGGANLALQCG